ncbi:MAG: hypothetical protein HY690_05715 [Chloroflexi bacterium]|nr:hypothetical protein [Chloroflexota bacterium]
METLAFYLSPLGLALTFVWNFAVLSSVQVTVRLLRLYSVRAMLLGAALLTVGTLPVTALYLALASLTYDEAVAQRLLAVQPAAWQAYIVQNRLRWLPVAMLLMAGLGFLVARQVLRFKRLRGAIVAALGVGILSAPWAALLVLPAP